MPCSRRGFGARKRNASGPRRIWLRLTSTYLGFVVTTVGLRFGSHRPPLRHQIATNNRVSHRINPGAHGQWSRSRTDSHPCFQIIDSGCPSCNRDMQRNSRKSAFHWVSLPVMKASSNIHVRQATLHTHDEQSTIDHRTLVVTIGPPCSGKTTFLRKLCSQEGETEGKTLTDTSIDNHPTVYYKVPLRDLLDGAEGSSEYAKELVHGRPLSERLGDSGVRETSMVAARLFGNITAEEFSSSVQQLRKASPAALAALTTAVEESVRDGVTISTAMADVFVREALFPLAIKSSQRRLEALARNKEGMIAWGNTNTQVRDFRVALEQARRTGRPVRFVRWGHELPFLSLTELLSRNVRRFAATGRYIEASAIESSLARIERMYASTGGGDPAKLALAAGYAMDTSGGLTRLPLENNVNSASFSDNTRLRTMKDVRPRRTGERLGSRGETAHQRGRLPRPSSKEQAADRTRSETDVDSRSRDSPRAWGRELGAVENIRECDGDPLSAPPLPVIKGGLHDRGLFPSNLGRVVLRLPQNWHPKEDSLSWANVEKSAMGSASRSLATDLMPPTVVFKNAWGRMRAWRRSQFSEEEIGLELPDPSDYFNRANGTTRGLKPFQEEHGSMNADEINLMRKIDEFRERR